MRLLKIHRDLQGPVISDMIGTATEQLHLLLDGSAVTAGQTVAVCVGSRGIARLPELIFTTIDVLRQRGLRPFLVPAMGSHGGATAEGQADVLRQLGIAAEQWGVAVHADMETEILGTTSAGVPVHFSRAALAADHVLLCNRVKPHTRFTGEIQSGLQKMLVIGLGKHAGAAAWHRAAHHIPFAQLVTEARQIIMQQVSLLGGLAILENAQEQIAQLAAVPGQQIAVREPELLRQAESLMARLPVRHLDCLIVDEIGKEISGTGLDTNIVGRKSHDHEADADSWCDIRLIYIRGLTDKTAGNATGIGMAEFTHAGVVDRVDWKKTAINSITAGHPTAAMCPVVCVNDREVFEAVCSIVGDHPRLIHIRNTLCLEEMLISENLRDEVAQAEPSTRFEAPHDLRFDAAGWIIRESV